MAQHTPYSSLETHLPTVAAVLHIPLLTFFPSSIPRLPTLLGLDPDHSTVKTAPTTSPANGLHTTVPTPNPLGSTLFILYILLALYFTYRVLRTLETRFDAHWSSLSFARKRTIGVFFALAALSFASLSWHMLAFLITHYLQSQDLYHPAGLLGDVLGKGKNSGSLALVRRVWYWTTHSALFTDFARSLCSEGREGSGLWWAKQDLMGTLSSYVFVNVARSASVGEVRPSAGGAGEQMVIWPFIALAQILPISFSLNLFFVCLLLSERPRRPKSSNRAEQGPGPRGSQMSVRLASIAASMILHVIYAQILDTFPMVSGDATLIKLVMATRLLLLLAAFAPVPVSGVAALYPYLRAVMAFGSVAALSLSVIWTGYWSVTYNHAIETLRYDFIFWTASVNIWYWLGSSQIETNRAPGKRTD